MSKDSTFIIDSTTVLDIYCDDDGRWHVIGDLRAPGTGMDDDANYVCRDALRPRFPRTEFDPEASCFYANAPTEVSANRLAHAIKEWVLGRRGENVPLYGEPGFSEGAEWRGKLASAFTHVAGTIGPFDPPGIKGQIRKGVISAVNAPATTFEAHKEHAEVVADRVICLAVVYDMVKELEQWRAAFGGTFEEVSERFLRGVEDDSQ